MVVKDGELELGAEKIIYFNVWNSVNGMVWYVLRLVLNLTIKNGNQFYFTLCKNKIYQILSPEGIKIANCNPVYLSNFGQICPI